MIDIILNEELIKQMSESIKRDYPGISDKEIKEYIRIALLMMYKNKEEIKIHARRKPSKERKELPNKKVYRILLKRNGQTNPIWMMTK